jgi:hypothetical protein
MIGAGKYDPETQELLEKLRAKAIVLMVFDGERGFGMSVKSDVQFLRQLPDILRRTAAGIEEEIRDDLSKL